MKAEDPLTEERRARMAAEQLLAQKEAELHAANRMLSRHALSLSEAVIEQREEVEEVKGENTRVRADLERANTEIDIAKRRLWNSIQSIHDGFAVFDADSRMVIANKAYLQPFDGLECVGPGAHYEEVIAALLAEGIIDIEDLTRDQWREEMLARWFSPHPEPRVVRLWDGTWVRLVDHRAPGGDTVCLGLNITESMQREAALNEARERAEDASRAKSAFLANMSHEIRTPMNGVVGMADLLAESGLDDEQRIYVDTIRASGQSLLTIINDVLDYSKIEARKFTLHPEPFDLERTILDVIQLMEPSVRGKGLKIMLDYDLFLPSRFEGDQVRVRQVLTNLVGNAVKFTESGHVLVRAVGVPGSGDALHSVHIIVEDTGIGIPAEKLSAVFDEFNQVEDGRNRAYAGTGLGLSISRQLVELMGGRIWVDSEPGVGSAFGVQLPLPLAEPYELPRLPGWLSHVCLVMNDDLSRTILEKRLTALGLRVTSVASAADLDQCGGTGADAIIASNRPSDMGASAVLAAMRRRGVTPPLLLITAPADGAPEVPPGVAALLIPPVSRPDLVATLTGLERDTDPLAAEPQESDAPASDDLAEAAADPPADAGTAGARRAMRVLAAEDNTTNRLVFSKLVKTCDIDLAFAGNGAEAVAAFEAAPPDLIFMDISMPGMDGREATSRIRAIEAARGLPRTRIVALTAHAMAGDAEEILSHGLDAHLAKPLKKPLILAEIAAARPDDARAPLPESG